MDFRTAYNLMLEGKKIKRPCFQGYWFIDGYKGQFTIHCRDGKDITEGNLGLTITNVLAKDWEEAKE